MLSVFVLLVSSQVVPPGLGTQPGELDGGEPFGDAFLRCGQCHDRAISNPGDPLYLPFDGWVSSMMANSVRDPLFQAALSIANQDVPGLGSWCLRCHAPQSYVRGHTDPPDGGAFDDLDLQGVTCDVCHRSIAAPDSGSPVIGNAQIYFERTNLKYGPYPDIGSPAHPGTDGGIVGSSELCGQCHQVFNPLVRWLNPEDGGVLGPQFPLDTTYDEWAQSKYARSPTVQTCQDCHLQRMTFPDGGPMQLYVAKFGTLRSAPRRHALVGGNLWGLEAVEKNEPNRTALLVEQFTETKRLTREMLASAAEITVTVPETVAPEGVLAITVRTRNKTGHKLPTGYADGRRIVVQVLINGKVLTGGFDGGHVIDDGWLRVYEARHGTLDAGLEDHLARHDVIVSDTRILPAGFRPPPGAATLPVPNALYDNGDGTWADYDEVVWHVDVPTTLKHGDPIDVTARLLYQATTPGYVHFLNDENRTTDAGKNLLDIWRATGEAAPVEMTRTQGRATVRDPDAGTGGSGGGAGGGEGGGTEPPIAACRCGASNVAVLLPLFALLLLSRRRRATDA